MRTLSGVLVAAALLTGVLVVWFNSTDDSLPDTEAMASSTSSTMASSTTEPPPITTTTPPSTSTTHTDESHVVETVEEAEAILRDLWFGWFEGIYNQDVERIREVVVLEATVETARDQFGTEFAEVPSPENLLFTGTELLRADDQCLAVWTKLSLSTFREGSSSGVHVLRWQDGWRRLSVWQFKEDLWDADCDSSLASG